MSTESGFADGGCTCRFVRFRMTRKPLFVHCCHCRWCQRETGASFAVDSDSMELTAAAEARINSFHLDKLADILRSSKLR